MSTAAGACLGVLLLGCSADRVRPPADDMVPVPAGSFIAGCEQSRSTECLPGIVPTPYEVAGFEIDRNEVTIADYQRCMDAGACKRDVHGSTPRHLPDPVVSAKLGNKPTNLPLWDVTGDEARAYCRWVGKRLPSELEWEKAARGTDGRLYPWGNAAPTCSLAALPGCAERGTVYLRPPGSVPAGASPYGVLDMFGNVGEWTDPAREGPPPGTVIGVGPARASQLGNEITLGLTYPTPPGEREFFLSPYTGFRCARSLLHR